MTDAVIEGARGIEALQALLPEWTALWEASPLATPFQAPGWLLPWAQTFAGERALTLSLRRRGRLIGLLPMTVLEGTGGDRLVPMGAGLSDYLDGVFAADAGAASATALLAEAAAAGPLLALSQLPPGSPLLAAASPPGWSEERTTGEPCPVLRLPAALPRRMAENLRYGRRRADRMGLQIRAIGPAEDNTPVLDALFGLHAARWSRRGEAGVLADPAVQSFHRQAAPQLAAAGLLRLHVCDLDGRTVAVLYALAAKRRVLYYIGGFDPALSSLGLGTLLVGFAIEEATREGAREFDFLRGREAYKYRWGAVDRPTTTRCLRAPDQAAA